MKPSMISLKLQTRPLKESSARGNEHEQRDTTCASYKYFGWRFQPLKIHFAGMKRITLLLAVLATLLISANVHAQGYRLAAGVRLSNSTPTLNNAVTVKYFATDETAVEGIISFGSRFGLGGLLEIHKPLNTGFSWFYGAGAYVGFEGGDTFIGPTGIIGLDYKFPAVPVNLSLDWKPELDITPKVNFVPNAFALSARFTFK